MHGHYGLRDWTSLANVASSVRGTYLGIKTGDQGFQVRRQRTDAATPTGHAGAKFKFGAAAEINRGWHRFNLGLDANAGQHLGYRLQHLGIVDIAIVCAVRSPGWTPY